MSVWAIVSKRWDVLSLLELVIKISLKSNMGSVNFRIWNADILHYILRWRISHLCLEQSVRAACLFPVVGHVHEEISPMGFLHLH